MPRHTKGFTLIELLIVVVIIGILAAIAIPRFASTKEKAYVASMKSDLRNLATYEESFAADSAGAYFAGVAFGTGSIQGISGVAECDCYRHNCVRSGGELVGFCNALFDVEDLSGFSHRGHQLYLDLEVNGFCSGFVQPPHIVSVAFQVRMLC